MDFWPKKYSLREIMATKCCKDYTSFQKFYYMSEFLFVSVVFLTRHVMTHSSGIQYDRSHSILQKSFKMYSSKMKNLLEEIDLCSICPYTVIS